MPIRFDPPPGGELIDDFEPPPGGELVNAVSDEPEAPGLGYRFLAGVAQKDIQQPEGFDVGDIAEFAGRELLPAIGGAAGAFAGPPGAALGAAAGRAAQKGIQGYIAGRNPELANRESLLESAQDVALTGVTSGLFEKAARVAGPYVKEGLKKFREARGSIGGDLLRVGPGVPQYKGQAAMEDLGLLSRAPSQKRVGELYDDFHNASGTVSRKKAIAGSADPFDTVARAKNDIAEAAQKLRSGTLTTQEAVNASQAARLIKDQARTGNEFAGEIFDVANDLKGQFDDFIGQTYPEWNAARQGAFERSVADEFTSWLPLNKNQSPNVLRTYTAGAAAATGAAAGRYGALGLPVLISPRVAGLGIRAAYRGSQIAEPLAELAARGGTVKLASDWLSRPQPVK